MRLFLILFATSILFFQCKDNSDKEKENAETAKEEIIPRDELENLEGYVKQEAERFILTERALAESKLDPYYANNPEPMQMLTSQVFDVDITIVVNQRGSGLAKEGDILEFSDEFSYKWYQDNEIYQKGKYFYGMKSDLLLMVSDNEAHFPSEWKVKSAGNVIVLAGTSTFKNNNTQIHMVGRPKNRK